MKLRIFCVILMAAMTFAQSSPVSSFEVASVRMNTDARNPDQHIEASPETLTMRNVTATAIVQWAYSISSWQISHPDWMDSQRYDVIAKANNPVTDQEMRRMLQTLLRERFSFTEHRETKQLNALMLVETKGGNKLKKVEEDGSPQIRKDLKGVFFHNMTLAEFAEGLARDAQMPVVDQTGLMGRYDFFIDPKSYNPPTKAEGQRLDALDMMQVLLPQQLGLRLEQRRTSVEMLIVDHMEKTPTEN